MGGFYPGYVVPSEKVQSQMDTHIIIQRHAGYYTAKTVSELFGITEDQARAEMHRFNFRHEQDTRIRGDGVLHVWESIYDSRNDKTDFLRNRENQRKAARNRLDERRFLG